MLWGKKKLVDYRVVHSASGTKASHCYSQHCEHHHYHPRALLAHWLVTVALCIIHQLGFEGHFSEEMTSLKKSLMEGGIKEVQLPAASAPDCG